MSQMIPNLKLQIIEVLQLIASKEQQLEYERNVPHVDITAELLCMWFDDAYYPDDASFTSCFTKKELAVLAEFHAFYDARHHRLPPSDGTIRTWLASPIWREIMQKAQETLTNIAA